VLTTQEVGDRCLANDTLPGRAAIVLNNGLPGQELSPHVPPEPARVVTRWKVQVGPGLGPFAQQLVIVRQVGEGDDGRLVGESAVETVVEGGNEFATRIPVAGSAYIGLRGPTGALVCDDASGHIGGSVDGPWATGEGRHIDVELDMGVPVTAVAELDRDGDGYGDETQDGCPDNALFHGPCPIVALTSGVIEVRRGAILIRPALNVNGRMAVSGSTSWTLPGRGQGKGTKMRRTRTVHLEGGEQEVLADLRATFRIPLPKAVTRYLGKLDRDRKLKAKLDLVAFGAVELEGRRMTKTLNVRLPGRA
jgi:hypothetical protein